MKLPRMLKERVFEIALEPELAKVLFPQIKNVERYKYAYAVYLGTPQPEIIFGHVASTLPKGMKKGFSRDFHRFIQRHPPRSFMDTVFLLDFYHFNASRLHHRYAPNRLAFTPIGIVNDMLKDSRGVLLWHYQLEDLIRFSYWTAQRLPGYERTSTPGRTRHTDWPGC